ncbi:MAG: FkbM family methyltransferase [Candidatus Tritonobacter lacicola]|nr:FkbM family methyltransferase [Candidatus Tritonobacter lacicola]
MTNIVDGLKEPRLSLKDICRLIDRTDNFVIYGINALGQKVTKMLERINKRVIGFVHSGDGGDLTDEEIDEIGKIDLKNSKIIIASYHELEIAKRLTAQCSLSYYKDFVFFDHVKMAIDRDFPDSFGSDFFYFLKKEQSKFKKAFNILEDEYSREIYQKVLKFRVDIFSPENIALDDLPTHIEVQNEYEAGSARYVDLLPSSIPESLRKDIAFKISLDPYSYFDVVTPRNKKVILNIGAYNNTSVMFAFLSPKSVIYAFEPQEDMHRQNVRLSEICPSIKPIKAGAWNRTGKVPFDVRVSDICGTTDSSIHDDGNSVIDVYRIDDFIAENNIECVDFIKMDIEGAELEALEGAKDTIREHGPDLAISIYHKPEHMHSIPLLIKDMCPEYKVYIDHRYYNPTATICFGTK